MSLIRVHPWLNFLCVAFSVQRGLESILLLVRWVGQGTGSLGFFGGVFPCFHQPLKCSGRAFALASANGVCAQRVGWKSSDALSGDASVNSTPPALSGTRA